MAFCVKTGDILIPKKYIDYEKFAVIACDQFTSEKDYWEKLKRHIRDSVSALNLILPEAYLKDDNSEEIQKIKAAMAFYLNENVFSEIKDSMIYVERSTPFTPMRKGIVALIDLEAYNYQGEKTPVRSSEGTVLSRIPPRAEIRKNAPLELPHVMLLMDDKENIVFDCIKKQKDSMTCLYNTPLNMDGGNITGYRIDNTQEVLKKLNMVAESASEKYCNGENLFLAVGDGNHSFAAAKSVWEDIKKQLNETEMQCHPARYALAEIVNIHDSGIQFHPIHRVFFINDNVAFINGLKAVCAKYKHSEGYIITGEGKEKIFLPEKAAQAVNAVQVYADEYTALHGGYTDYVHGEKLVINICKEKNAVGVLLPSMKKEDFFSYIVSNGTFPRKCFSMGEANEKRYYIEARKLY